ncbi:hypothetical protein ACHAWF_013304 [Thalassiosira exigua]
MERGGGRIARARERREARGEGGGGANDVGGGGRGEGNRRFRAPKRRNRRESEDGSGERNPTAGAGERLASEEGGMANSTINSRERSERGRGRERRGRGPARSRVLRSFRVLLFFPAALRLTRQQPSSRNPNLTSNLPTPIRSRAWPRDVADDYERVRPLGRGAFGVVWLARAKRPESEPQCAAVKRMGARTPEEREYASREIAILSEVRHPNVVRCLRSAEVPGGRLAVLTLADGPDLGALVRRGGALSLDLARLAARHLVAAVSYLHGRGVIHRDLKPDNLVLARTGTVEKGGEEEDWPANDALWDDRAKFDDGAWKVVLVDFGFARALAPQEIGLRSGPKGRVSVRNLFERSVSKRVGGERAAPSSSSRPGSRLKRASSVQKMSRAMSALGTRAFAAPEVRRARDKSDDHAALSACVADYGLVSDAYSVGCTIKMILTGVPAGENEMEFMGAHGGFFADAMDALCGCRKKKGGGGGAARRKKRYKFLDETPKPARDLVGKLMRPKEGERLTVPLAREEPWIKGGTGEGDPVVRLPAGDHPGGNDDPIVCLKCAGE